MKSQRWLVVVIATLFVCGCGGLGTSGQTGKVLVGSALPVQPTPAYTASGPVIIDPPNMGVPYVAKTITFQVQCKDVTPLVKPSSSRMALTPQGYPLWLLDDINLLVGPKFAGETIGTGKDNDAASYREQVYGQIVAENQFREIKAVDQWSGLQVPAECRLHSYYAMLPKPS